jgi:hypothetical protein
METSSLSEASYTINSQVQRQRAVHRQFRQLNSYFCEIIVFSGTSQHAGLIVRAIRSDVANQFWELVIPPGDPWSQKDPRAIADSLHLDLHGELYLPSSE